MIEKQRVKFLKLFAVLFLVALLFQLYIERENLTTGSGFPHSFYSALCYSFPVALVAALALLLFARTRDGE